jgi:dTDP-4-amino-4,6-dideoxygalactose transaminase
VSMIRITEPVIGIEEEEAVLRVIRSGWLSAGVEVCSLEEEFASYIGALHAVACSSGYAALQLALECLNLSRGESVVVPSFTFTATAASVLRAGGDCVFADVESLDSPTLSPADCAARIVDDTKGVIFVTYGGYAGSLEGIAELARQKHLPLILDATHAPGAVSEGGASIVEFGLCSAYSFHSTKNLTAGEGGMLVTNDPSIADEARRRRAHGLSRFLETNRLGFDYKISEVAGNSRMSELAAAVLRAQLIKLPLFNSARRDNTARYDELLRGSSVHLPFLAQRLSGVAHLYPVILPVGADRRSIRKKMFAKGIETSVHYVPLHTQPAFRTPEKRIELPVTEDISGRILSLPLHPNLKSYEVEFVASALLEAIKCM